MDDLYILGNDLAHLWELNYACTQYLAGLRLRPHPDKVQISRTSEAVDVLGYRVSRGRRWLRNDNGYRFRRLMALYRAGRLEWADLLPSVQSWIGHARHAETAGLREAIFGPVVFDREGWLYFVTGVGQGARRVPRGGSWNNNLRNARVSNRNRNDPANRNDNNVLCLAQSARAALCRCPDSPRSRLRGA